MFNQFTSFQFTRKKIVCFHKRHGRFNTLMENCLQVFWLNSNKLEYLRPWITQLFGNMHLRSLKTTFKDGKLVTIRNFNYQTIFRQIPKIVNLWMELQRSSLQSRLQLFLQWNLARKTTICLHAYSQLKVYVNGIHTMKIRRRFGMKNCKLKMC